MGAPHPTAGGGPAEAWASLQDLRNAIAGDVEAGRLGEIHAKSERLTPLANALLESSSTLAPDKRARVDAGVKQLPKLADALHEAADAGDAEATRRELKRLDGLLELIRAQYPPDALAPPAAPSGGSAHSRGHPGAHEEEHAQAPAAGHSHAARPLAAVDLPALATLQVRGTEFGFEPRSLEVRAGAPTRIELANDGLIEHSLVVTAPDGGGDWIHLHAGPKGTDAATYRIEKPGRYPVLCAIPGHVEAGMVGELVVVQ